MGMKKERKKIIVAVAAYRSVKAGRGSVDN
jgi:hypothetical protein